MGRVWVGGGEKRGEGTFEAEERSDSRGGGYQVLRMSVKGDRR